MSGTKRFSHLAEDGSASMVDVSGKRVTRREARASCRVLMRSEVVDQLAALPKGDAYVVAKIAGIQAGKRTDHWIPLAHPLPLDHVEVTFDTCDNGLKVTSTVVCTARTGAEMEALVACSAAALALYDMVKAVQKDVVITDLQLQSKTGGRSGDYCREQIIGDPARGDREGDL